MTQPWSKVRRRKGLRRWLKRRWYRFLGWTWIAEGYLNPRRRYREIKWFIQRGRRGWADCDAWDLDMYLARVISESVERFRKITVSHPVGTTPARWDRKLQRIAAAYRREIANLEAHSLDNGGAAQRHERELLARYFGHLWD